MSPTLATCTTALRAASAARPITILPFKLAIDDLRIGRNGAERLTDLVSYRGAERSMLPMRVTFAKASCWRLEPDLEALLLCNDGTHEQARHGEDEHHQLKSRDGASFLLSEINADNQCYLCQTRVRG